MKSKAIGATLFLVLAYLRAEEAGKVIQARRAVTAPKIDGILEELWTDADSASNFIQQQPHNGKPASEPTTVYLLFDDDHLFFAFRCEVADMTQVRDRLSEEPDGVRLLLDTFDDNTTCYCFIVGFNGVESDYRITGDGAVTEAWDGVWWSAVKRELWGYGIEIAIPFKTLRYSATKDEWGIDFGRSIVTRGELSFWAHQTVTGYRVSRMGRLSGIKPGPQGRQIEFYPVGLLRQEKSGDDTRGWSDRVGAEFGVDITHCPSSTGSFQLTIHPDFAQIEADPYQVNLSRYEPWLAERRPFFVEAVENFGGSSQPVKLFYSRRIGKPLANGRVVPILAGLKWTGRLPRGQYGMLTVYTGECEDEPKSFYSAFAVRRQVLGNSEIGLLYAGKDYAGFSNHGVGLDGVFRTLGLNQRLFVAGSQYGDSFDYALSFDGGYKSEAFAANLSLRQIAPRFNINGPGYTTWRGRYASFYAGPVVYNQPPVQFGSFYPGVEIQREWCNPKGIVDWSGFINSSIRFLSQEYLGVWVGYGGGWALARSFHRGYVGGNFATDNTKGFSFDVWLNYYHRTANYRQGIIAPIAQGELTIQERIGDRWSVWLGNGVTVEPDSLGRVDWQKDVTNVIRPGIEHSFSAKASVRLSWESVLGYDQNAGRGFASNSLFALYSWTFSPRSVFYFASNYLWEQGDIKIILVAKVRYLFNL
ncbi:MAG: DUF5916 domain-containing protein [bacterium]